MAQVDRDGEGYRSTAAVVRPCKYPILLAARSVEIYFLVVVLLFSNCIAPRQEQAQTNSQETRGEMSS